MQRFSLSIGLKTKRNEISEKFFAPLYHINGTFKIGESFSSTAGKKQMKEDRYSPVEKSCFLKRRNFSTPHQVKKRREIAGDWTYSVVPQGHFH